jgi:hypothetical protein
LALGAALAAFALLGCNKLGLLYEYADKLVLYNVEDNFDLDKPQRTRVKEDIEAYFGWHRRQMLPAYVDFLVFIAGSMRNGLKPAEVDSGYRRYQALARATMDSVTGKSVVMLQSLAPEQIDAWQDKQRKKNQKQRKQFSGSLQERLDQRCKKIIDEMEDWTGRLTKEQKSRIKVLNNSLPWNGNLWLDTREMVQDSLAAMLRRKAPAADLEALLTAYFRGADSLKSEEYRTRNREFERRLCTLIYMIHNTLTTEQKRSFLQQVDKTAQDFRALSKAE